ncbi:MAG: hypothetical protein KDK99_07035 [Verrucomicrobiales bacterium]|nr:hypothetical protein [Verrucomicrobiales bacterium]
MKRWLTRCLKFALGLALVFGLITCTTPLPTPKGVTVATRRVAVGEDSIAVDFYLPEKPPPGGAPLVVVAHGFSRDKRHMQDWGNALAQRGMMAAVLTQPKYLGHRRNSRAIAALAELRPPALPAATNGQIAYIGYSMGGLTTLLAATAVPPAAWVGLDPVEFGTRGEEAARQISAPGLALLAEKAPFNRYANGLPMLAAYAGPMQVRRVRGAQHLDPEKPVDLLGQIACGRWNDARHGVFVRQGVGFLEAVFSGKAERMAAWRVALDEDAALKTVPLPAAGGSR